MGGGRWLLLVLMVLAGPLLWWAGVADTTTDAYAAVAPDDASGRYFVSNYDGPGRSMAAIFAFVNLVLLAVLMPTARQLRTGITGTFVRAAVTSMLALALAWFEWRFNPVTTNWGGDPDAWSMVKDHIAPEAGRAGTLWFAVTAVTAATIAVWALSSAASAAGDRRAPGAAAGDRPSVS